jgi:hypothetical protein
MLERNAQKCFRVPSREKQAATRRQTSAAGREAARACIVQCEALNLKSASLFSSFIRAAAAFSLLCDRMARGQ